MKEKTIRKITVFSILFCLCISLLLCLSFVSATSTETTLGANEIFENNQNTEVEINGWTVIAIGQHIIFYDSANGDLVKSWTVTDYNNWEKISSKIYTFNSSHVMVACCGFSGAYAKGTVYLLNINTLATQKFESSLLTVGNSNSGITFVHTSNYVYVVFGQISGANTLQQKLYPTVDASPTQISDDLILYSARTITISSTVTNTFYIITQYQAYTRYSIYKYNPVTPSITLIGTSATDNTYGTFIYLFGYSTDTYNGNTWYDVGIVSDIEGVANNVQASIIRFNDTFVDINRRGTWSLSSSVNINRPLNVFYSGIWDTISLIEGDYGYIYVGGDYGLMMAPFTISGLSSLEPDVDISVSPSVYGDNGAQWIHHYTTSNNVGGLIYPSGIGFQIDYQNHKCIANKWITLNPSYSYLFSLTPQPLQLIGSGSVLRAVCMYSTTYTYNGEIFASGIRAGNGTYQVSSTGLSSNYNIATTGTYGSTSNTGSIVNGLITFTISPRTSAYVTIYEGIKVTIIINGATQSFIHTFVWTSDVNEDGLPPTTTSPTQGTLPTGDTGIGGTGGINLLSGGTFIGLLITVLFTMLFGAFAGRDGILAGLMFGILISSLLGLFPIYGILLSVVFGAILLLSHTSIGRGGGESGE